MTQEPSRTVIIGIGNCERGDDAAGRQVARNLRDSIADDVEVHDVDGEATSLISLFDGVSSVYLIDACSSGSPAGSVFRFEAGQAPLPDREFGVSTHGFGLSAAIEIARALGQLPPRCVVYAIEGETFTAGAALSAPVAIAAVSVAQRIRAELVEPQEAVRHA